MNWKHFPEYKGKNSGIKPLPSQNSNFIPKLKGSLRVKRQKQKHHSLINFDWEPV
jgi:hypothetical protein